MDPRQMRVLPKNSSGQSLIEFAFVSLGLVMLLFGVVEMCRLALVYTTIANAARVGVRYATVHGSDNPVSRRAIKRVVDGYLRAATVYTPTDTVTTAYPDAGCSNRGCHVNVTVSYPYNPLTSYFPTNVNLSSTSQGVVAF